MCRRTENRRNVKAVGITSPSQIWNGRGRPCFQHHVCLPELVELEVDKAVHLCRRVGNSLEFLLRSCLGHISMQTKGARQAAQENANGNDAFDTCWVKIILAAPVWVPSAC